MHIFNLPENEAVIIDQSDTAKLLLLELGWIDRFPVQKDRSEAIGFHDHPTHWLLFTYFPQEGMGMIASPKNRFSRLKAENQSAFHLRKQCFVFQAGEIYCRSIQEAKK